MNYKKLKCVLALSLAVVLSVPTSIYGGALEVYAAEQQELPAEGGELRQESKPEERDSRSEEEPAEVSNHLSEENGTNNSSSEKEESSSAEEKKEKTEEQSEQPSSVEEKKEETEEQSEQPSAAEEKKEAAEGQSAEEKKEEQKEETIDPKQTDTQSNTDEQSSIMVVEEIEAEQPVMAANKSTAPTKVEKFEAEGLFNIGFSAEYSNWIANIETVCVNETKYSKSNTVYSWNENKWAIGSYTFGDGTSDNSTLRITGVDSLTYPVIFSISADGYNELKMKVQREGKSWNYTYNVEVVTDTNPDVPVGQTYAVTKFECTNGTLTVDSSTEVAEGATVTVTATPDSGHEVDKVTVLQNDNTEVTLTAGAETGVYTFTMPASDVTVSATFKAAAPVETGKITLSQLEFTKASFENDWILNFKNAYGYVSAITDVKVNGTSWEAKSYISSGGAYKKNTDENTLTFASTDFSSNPTIPVLKSGDVITITATGYENLTFKLVIDLNGNAFLVEDDNQGDPYELHVKIEGSFEAAIVGQKDYDGVSSASTGGSSSNKNSAVKVYGALVKKDTDLTDGDWEELNHLSKIQLEGSKCSVSIVPDVVSGTAESSDSGMQGVYMTLSNDLTLDGTPEDPGTYLISVSIEDNQGRTATSNTLPFRIYTGEETLAERLKEENLKLYASGLYAWDIMEPWAIKNFGSNVDGQEESVRVPAGLEVWFGSHESGTYGYLGYDIPWADVKAGNIPQTLYIPAGCNLTLTNMEILSSVRIVVENGGKLTLSDSVVQGIIDVQSGGTFSMNYDAYNNAFTTGSSLCGQLCLEDGATLENAAIYSHTNYLANGDLTDRSNDDAVVSVTGNVTLKGRVFISGDEAGSTMKGQTALQVKNGTLNLQDGAVLATYGGGGNTTLYSEGGNAIRLENGAIAGNGKVIALGGSVTFGAGGNAAAGNGEIKTSEVFLQGATSYTAKDAEPGKALDGEIDITSGKRYVADGTQIESGQNDPLYDLYWKTGTEAAPDLTKYVTEAAKIFTVKDIPDMVYSGEALKPQITVMDEGVILTEGTHYKVTCKQTLGRTTAASVIDAGTYNVIVSGIGSYGGNVEKTFIVAPKKTIFAVTEDTSSAVYDGQNKRPVVTVKDGEIILAEGIDYTITVSVDGKEYTAAEFVSAGVYQMTITGIGNYEGSTGKASFTISEKSSDQNKNDNGNNGSNTSNGTADNGSNTSNGTADNGNNTSNGTANNGGNADNGTVDNGNNTDNGTTNNNKKKKKHSSHNHASEEETAVQTTAAENTEATDINSVPATGDTVQTEQWILLSTVSLAAIGIFLETRKTKKR